MRILYLTWGETPRSYGVFGSQVIRQFVENKKEMPGSDFYFISGLPIINSGLVREKLGYFREFNRVKTKLKNIKMDWVPIWAPQNFIQSNRFTFKLMFFGALYNLKRHISKINPNIIHCRSYHAAWAALEIKRKYNFDYKIVFDARGILPEEISLKRGWDFDNANYKYLKEVERKIIASSAAVVAVSEPMSAHFQNINASARVETVYLSADFDTASELNVNQKAGNSEISFCYVGALSESGWHKPSSLVKIYSKLKLLYSNSKLVIVTTSNHSEILSFFSEFEKSDVKIYSAKNISEVRSHISNCTFGILSYFEPRRTIEFMLADMVMAVKTAEYLSFGLPLIVNKYCGGASGLVNRFKLGVSYDPLHINELKSDSIDSYIRTPKLKKKMADAAFAHFDYVQHARQYVEIYRSLFCDSVK